MVIFSSCETWQWLDLNGYRYAARCMLPLLWVAGAAGYLGAGMRLGSIRLRQTGLVVLAIAGFLAAIGYYHRVDGEYPLYINGYFGAGLTVPLMVFAYAVTLRKLPNLSDPDEQVAAKVLCGIGVALVWLLLSAETYLYFRQAITDHERATWIAQMSLSVLWAAYAIALLVIGFWQGVRWLRLAALALFGLTAIKLVLVDMARVEEVYRIVSFFVLGILMIGASYLYHRVEKQLAMSSARKD